MRPPLEHPGTVDRALSCLAPMYLGERDYRRPLIHPEEANVIELGNGTQTVEP